MRSRSSRGRSRIREKVGESLGGAIGAVVVVWDGCGEVEASAVSVMVVSSSERGFGGGVDAIVTDRTESMLMEDWRKRGRVGKGMSYTSNNVVQCIRLW